jgi:hypothetical protein
MAGRVDGKLVVGSVEFGIGHLVYGKRGRKHLSIFTYGFYCRIFLSPSLGVVTTRSQLRSFGHAKHHLISPVRSAIIANNGARLFSTDIFEFDSWMLLGGYLPSLVVYK